MLKSRVTVVNVPTCGGIVQHFSLLSKLCFPERLSKHNRVTVHVCVCVHAHTHILYKYIHM